MEGHLLQGGGLVKREIPAREGEARIKRWAGLWAQWDRVVFNLDEQMTAVASLAF